MSAMMTLVAVVGFTSPGGLDWSDAVQRFVTELVRAQIPVEFEDERKWGMTKEVFDGVSVTRKGLRVSTKRKRKTVNHGSWKRYEVRLVDPDDTFGIRVHDIRATPEGEFEFEITVDAQVAAFGRLSQWNRGIQIVSVSANCDATIRMTARCRLGLEMDTDHFPPAVIARPRVMNADLRLLDFQLNRISNLGGPLVSGLSSSVRELLEDEIAERRDRLVEKINRQISKKQDRLRLSVRDLFGKS